MFWKQIVYFFLEISPSEELFDIDFDDTSIEKDPFKPQLYFFDKPYMIYMRDGSKHVCIVNPDSYTYAETDSTAYVKLSDFFRLKYKMQKWFPINDVPTSKYKRFQTRSADNTVLVEIQMPGTENSCVIFYKFSKEYLDQYYESISALGIELKSENEYLCQKLKLATDETYSLRENILLFSLLASTIAGYLLHKQDLSFKKAFLCSTAIFLVGCYLASQIKINPEVNLEIAFGKRKIENFQQQQTTSAITH